MNLEDLTRSKSRFAKVKTFKDTSKKVIIKKFSDKKLFEQYLDALVSVRKNGVLVPKVLSADDEKMEITLEYVEGEPLFQIKSRLSREELVKIYEQAAEILYKIHRSKTKNINKPFFIYFKDTWTRELEKVKDPHAYRFAKQLLETISWESQTLFLVHGDYTDNNWIIKDGKIAGILDWECTMYFDPFYDLAIFEGWEEDKELRKALVMRYLALAGEKYRVYHEFKIVYQVYYILQTDPKLIDSSWEDLIWMIEADRNISFNRIFHKRK